VAREKWWFHHRLAAGDKTSRLKGGGEKLPGGTQGGGGLFPAAVEIGKGGGVQGGLLEKGGKKGPLLTANHKRQNCGRVGQALS